jgi:threonyl-tRNA synthetase
MLLVFALPVDELLLYMQAVFWHSSAHCLGHAMECKYGCHLTHGPPIEQGFFYDCYMGDNVVADKVIGIAHS